MGDLMQGGERDTRKCVAQTYWYDDGVQRAVWCEKDATMEVRALDGSRNPACDEHGALMIESGAARVLPPANPVAEPTQRQWGGDGEGERG